MRMARTRRGKPTTAEAITAPDRVKMIRMSRALQQRPEKPGSAEEYQEQITDHHRRQDKGQIDQPLKQSFARYPGKGQDVGHGKAKGGGDHGSAAGDLDRQPDGMGILGVRLKNVSIVRENACCLRNDPIYCDKSKFFQYLLDSRAGKIAIKGLCFRLCLHRWWL